MNKLPLIIWNHRWEYDKNPDEFFKLLFDLKNEGILFEVAILGERYTKYPKIFDEAKAKLKNEIVVLGYAETIEEYKNWLKKGDIIPVTSNQDFFGESLVQAMYHNCYPLVPDRLVFPEHFPENIHWEFVYKSYDELFSKTKNLILNIEQTRTIKVRQFVEKYSWDNIISVYDEAFEKLVNDEKK